MEIKSRVLFWILIVLVVLSVSATYYRYVVLQDYLVEAELDCDPVAETCFIWECDPEIDGAEYCTGDPEEDTWYYKFAYRNAYNITICDPEDEECDPFACMHGEEGCEQVLCDEETLVEYEFEEGAVCTNPDDFADWLLEEGSTEAETEFFIDPEATEASEESGVELPVTEDEFEIEVLEPMEESTARGVPQEEVTE